MKHASISFFILIFSVFYAQAQRDGGYYITYEGKKVIMDTEVAVLTHVVEFVNKGKLYRTVITNIKYAKVGKKTYISIPNGSFKFAGLYQIVCYNDKYILTNYNRNGQYYFFVWDWDLKKVARGYPDRNRRSKWKGDLDKFIKPYFGECNELIKLMEENIQNPKHYSIAWDINCFKCGSKDIAPLLKTFMIIK